MKKFDLKNLQGSKRTLRSGSYATVLAVVVLAFVILVHLLGNACTTRLTRITKASTTTARTVA